jgi:HEAT repeat protein
MDTELALAFLKAHQPMPSDAAISDEDGATFAAIVKHFEATLDERCIPLLIHSVSPNTWLGVYEHIKFVLMAHPCERVIPYLQRGLLDGNDGVRSRCCWWAADVSAWELVDLIRPLTAHPDEDVRGAAQAFIELRDELHAA